MKIYISSSWKNRDRVRNMAISLRELGHDVYDFTDPTCRKVPEIPPEMFPEEFDPAMHSYREYIQRGEWREAVTENKRAITEAELIVLLLPCGNDSHADWALGVGMGKDSVVIGQPRKGERSPVHIWADAILDDEDALIAWLAKDEEDTPKKKHLTVEQAMSALPDGEDVHTFRNPGGMLLGCDMPRGGVKDEMERAEYIELAGESAKGMGHGIAIIPLNCKYLGDVLFVETVAERLDALEVVVS